MRFSYFDANAVSPNRVKKVLSDLEKYRKKVASVVLNNDSTQPEYSLIYAQNPGLHQNIDAVKKQYKHVKHLVLIGIGGSSLGTEAIHSVLNTGKVKLHCLDTVSAHKINELLKVLRQVKKVEQVAVCVISKSGNTAETLANAGVLLEQLQQQLGKKIYQQTIFIGNANTSFLRGGKRLGVQCIAMPEIIGGRYSIMTEVGLIPLAILGHDTDAIITGALDANNDDFENSAADSAARIFLYTAKKYRHYNFFAFETRLAKVGEWYRQLFAESLGKAIDKKKQPVTRGMLPTISTAVELHSVGQLYLSGFTGVYTDFVTFDDGEIDFQIPKSQPSKTYARFTVEEISAAIYGGVIGAYQDAVLPHRTTIFTEETAYSLGLFVGMRMREVMYVAHLMNIEAFDQPNVESYKIKTREILGL